jgi:hypothetical protein
MVDESGRASLLNVVKAMSSRNCARNVRVTLNQQKRGYESSS